MAALRPLKPSEWVDFANTHSNLKHYVTVASRPGSLLLGATMEYNHFPPRTPANQNYHSQIVEWRETHWHAFSVPKSHHEIVVQNAKALALEIRLNPPSMALFGMSAVLTTVPVHLSQTEIRASFRRQGVPEGLLDLFRGLDPFPGKVSDTHAIETDGRRFTPALKNEEWPTVRNREFEMINVLERGIRPPLSQIADYLYGRGRVRPQLG